MEVPRVHINNISVQGGQHYHPDGDMYLQSEDVMFRVSANKLCGDSEPLQSLITECRENLPNFAKEPVWALYIENATPRELFDFLNYLYAEDDEDLRKLHERESYESLHGILHVSSLFSIARGRQYSIQRLENLPGITAFQRLRISSDYRYPPSYREAARQIVWRDETDFTLQELITITTFLPDLLTIRDNIRGSRSRLISHGPECVQDNCAGSPAACKASFLERWESTAAGVLRQHEIGPDFDALILDSLADEYAACASCRKTFLDATQQVLVRERDWVERMIGESIDGMHFDNADLGKLLAAKRAGYDTEVYANTGMLSRRSRIY